MLPQIVCAVGDKTEVWVDGGIRTGQDVLKALAMGARGTMIGRAYIYGLGAMGQEGVTKALEVIRKELDITMAPCGERDIANLGLHNLLIRRDFEADWAQGTAKSALAVRPGGQCRLRHAGSARLCVARHRGPAVLAPRIAD